MTAAASLERLEELTLKRKEVREQFEAINAEWEKELYKTKYNGRPQAAAIPAAQPKPAKKPKATEEGQNTLKEVIRTVLNNRRLVLKDIVTAVLDDGYISKAKEFGTVVYQNLRIMMENGEIEKDAERKYFLV